MPKHKTPDNPIMDEMIKNRRSYSKIMAACHCGRSLILNRKRELGVTREYGHARSSFEAPPPIASIPALSDTLVEKALEAAQATAKRMNVSLHTLIVSGWFTGKIFSPTSGWTTARENVVWQHRQGAPETTQIMGLRGA